MRAKKRFTKEETLRAKPIRNESFRWERTSEGEISIIIHRRKVWWIWLLSKIFFIPKKRKFRLDKIGSDVWDMCDGETTVEQMIKRISKSYKLSRREAEVSLLNYLKQLAKKGVVGFLIEP